MITSIRYECDACGWRWTRKVSTRTTGQAQRISDADRIILVPRERGPCKCSPSDERLTGN